MSLPVDKIRIASISTLCLITAFLLWSIAVPSGRVTYSQDFQDGNYHRIGRIKPIDRTLPPTETGTTILGGPAYFALRATRPFDQAEVEVTYRTSPNFRHQQLELGMLTNRTMWQYQLKPLENRTLDWGLRNWPVIASGTEFLLQRQPVFASIEDFKQAPPPFEQVALYQSAFNLERNFSNVPAGKIALQQSLVGGYSFYTAVNDGRLSVRFGFNELHDQDIKRSKVEVLLYEGKNLVKIYDLTPNRKQTLGFGWWVDGINLVDLAPGYYKVELRADDNLETKTINLNQSTMAFVGRLRFNKFDPLPAKLWTNSREVSFLARTSESVGDVYLNQKRQLVAETYRQYSFKTDQQLTELDLSRPGLELSGDGVFVFNQSNFFDPRLKQVDYLTDLDREGVNYILADYQSPIVRGEWRTATADFNFRQAQQDKDGYMFMISVPGFKTDDNRADWLEVKEIKITLTGDTPWQYAKRKVKNVVRRVIF